MADKLHEYQGWGGRLHGIRDSVRERWQAYRERHPQTLRQYLRETFLGIPQQAHDPGAEYQGPYADLFRRKTRLELMRISAAVMGIEFSYAGETAFVSPTLLQIGVPHQHMTLVWALSPLVGFFLTPILGSVSDGCRSKYGRRRPFIAMMSLGVLLGLLLVPNGEDLGYAMGDALFTNRTSAPSAIGPRSGALESSAGVSPHPWGVFFTVLGTVFLDFDADACQSPARAYLLDVTVPEDHAKGLSTFTVMAGLGGFMGYSLGGINWDQTSIGILFGGHVRAVFSLITVIFIACVSATLTSFQEIPLDELHIEMERNKKNELNYKEDKRDGEGEKVQDEETYEGKKDEVGTEKDNLKEFVGAEYGSLNRNELTTQADGHVPEKLTLTHYLRSTVVMPASLRLVCLTNLFCWMAHVCYSLYFTDFVGESVYGGDPAAPEGSVSRRQYEEGVRFGCWGMAMYSLSCACYSLLIEKLIKRLGARKVYIGALCVYSTGMFALGVIRAPAAVLLFSWTAGVMYCTLFTMPYLLVAHYHATGIWDDEGGSIEPRGLGTDVAVVSSCVFVAQLLVSLIMGTAVSLVRSTAAVVFIAAFLAACAALTATKITYLDL